jgi:hypothetical protein
MNAPIAIFCYNRLDNLKLTIDHLRKNLLANQSDVYIFSDGGKDNASWKAVNKVRAYLRTITGFKTLSIVERETNYYLERNIIEGIAYVLQKHDRIIVLEDDICTSPYFLTFMNEALDYYADNKRVMHVSGFTNLDIQGQGDTYFTPHMGGWGWATWRDRWQYFTHYQSRKEALAGLTNEDEDNIQYGGAFQILKMLDRKPIPWDICWNINIYRQKGLCLTPTHTLTRNCGLYQGTHFHSSRLLGIYEYDRPFSTRHIEVVNPKVEANPAIEKMYETAMIDHGMRYNWFGKTLRFFYKKVIRK